MSYDPKRIKDLLDQIAKRVDQREKIIADLLGKDRNALISTLKNNQIQLFSVDNATLAQWLEDIDNLRLLYDQLTAPLADAQSRFASKLSQFTDINERLQANMSDIDSLITNANRLLEARSLSHTDSETLERFREDLQSLKAAISRSGEQPSINTTIIQEQHRLEQAWRNAIIEGTNQIMTAITNLEMALTNLATLRAGSPLGMMVYEYWQNRLTALKRIQTAIQNSNQINRDDKSLPDADVLHALDALWNAAQSAPPETMQIALSEWRNAFNTLANIAEHRFHAKNSLTTHLSAFMNQTDRTILPSAPSVTLMTASRTSGGAGGISSSTPTILAFAAIGIALLSIVLSVVFRATIPVADTAQPIQIVTDFTQTPAETTPDMSAVSSVPTETPTDEVVPIGDTPDETTPDVSAVSSNPDETTPDVSVISSNPDETTPDVSVISSNPAETTPDVSAVSSNPDETTPDVSAVSSVPTETMTNTPTHTPTDPPTLTPVPTNTPSLPVTVTLASAKTIEKQGETVAIVAQTQNVPQGLALIYRWYVDDTLSGQSDTDTLSLLLAEARDYKVRVEVADVARTFEPVISDSFIIQVVGINFTFQVSGANPLQGTFSPIITYDGTPTNYAWDVNSDGNPERSDRSPLGYFHSYSTSGTYNATLTVTIDGVDLSHSREVIIVAPPTPTPTATPEPVSLITQLILDNPEGMNYYSGGVLCTPVDNLAPPPACATDIMALRYPVPTNAEEITPIQLTYTLSAGEQRLANTQVRVRFATIVNPTIGDINQPQIALAITDAADTEDGRIDYTVIADPPRENNVWAEDYIATTDAEGKISITIVMYSAYSEALLTFDVVENELYQPADTRWLRIQPTNASANVTNDVGNTILATTDGSAFRWRDSAVDELFRRVQQQVFYIRSKGNSLNWNGTTYMWLNATDFDAQTPLNNNTPTDATDNVAYCTLITCLPNTAWTPRFADTAPPEVTFAELGRVRLGNNEYVFVQLSGFFNN